MAAPTTDTVTLAEELTPQQAEQLDLSVEQNLRNFVGNATWRELLVELVSTDKLDPWNIDLVKIVESYVGVIRKMKVLDLHVPANIILAAAILLRMKSETFKIFEIEEPVQEQEELLPGAVRVIPEVEPLVPRLRMQPNKRVTLYELMGALDDVMKLKEKRELLVQASGVPMQFYIDKDDIDQKVELIYNLVQDNADKTGMTTFSYLLDKFEKQDKVLVDLFVPLLFLAHKQRIIIMQEKFFDEIIIKMNGKVNG